MLTSDTGWALLKKLKQHHFVPLFDSAHGKARKPTISFSLVISRRENYFFHNVMLMNSVFSSNLKNVFSSYEQRF
jgi:hypothetical protein